MPNATPIVPNADQRKLQRQNGHETLQLRMLGDNINLERFQWNELADILEGRTAGDVEERETLIKRIRRLVWVETERERHCNGATCTDHFHSFAR